MAGYGPIILRTNTLKQTHPEYLLGTPKKRPKHGAWTAVNYGLPAIRDLAFRYVEEVCTNYDVDGIELDFFRHPVFFSSTAAGQLATVAERTAMTELLQRIRTMADQVGSSRGRPILIALRVPDSVGYWAIGLDLDTWLAGDLLDLLVVSSYFQLNDWDYSVALAHRYRVKIYPSLDESRVNDASAKAMRMTNLAYRGRAANIWAFGADGVYMFNFFDRLSPLWRELGDPPRLATLDKDYFGSVRGAVNAAGGNLPYAPYQTVETLNPGNPKTMAPGKTITARINVGEDCSQAGPVSLKLRLRFKSPPDAKLLQVTFNNHQPKFLRVDRDWVKYALSPQDVRSGANQTRVTLTASAPQRTVWTDLLLEVRH